MCGGGWGGGVNLTPVYNCERSAQLAVPAEPEDQVVAQADIAK